MESNSSPTGPKPGTKSPGPLIAVVGILVLGSLIVGGVMPRMQQKKSLAEDSADINNSVRAVTVASPHMAPSEPLQLPSTMRALEETQIYARTSGYLVKRYVDIGSHVKQGDILAEIQSPDVDQQAFQATADQAKAVAAVGQSQADVRNKQAGVEATQAEIARSRASIEQAKASYASSQSKLAQTRSGLASSTARVAQVRQTLETQKAALKQAEAQRELAEATAKRYRSMLVQGFVSQQDADQAEATFKTTSASVEAARASVGAAQANVDAALQDVESSKAVVRSAEADVRSSKENVTAAQAALGASQANMSAAQANVGASKANVAASMAQVRSNQANSQRFSVLQSFSKIVAPFDGVITARNADVGALIAPGDASNAKLALFSIARVDTLRIQIAVPQTYFQAVKAGTKVSFTVREIPGRTFEGVVFQNAGAIDPATRTLLTEVRVDNKQNTLIPGMYAQVQFTIKNDTKAIRVPANTLTVDAGGTRVDVVGPDKKLRFVPIKVGRDFGAEVEVVSGLKGDELLVSNPTDDLKDGESVNPIPAKDGK